MVHHLLPVEVRDSVFTVAGRIGRDSDRIALRNGRTGDILYRHRQRRGIGGTTVTIGHFQGERVIIVTHIGNRGRHRRSSVRHSRLRRIIQFQSAAIPFILVVRGGRGGHICRDFLGKCTRTNGIIRIH